MNHAKVFKTVGIFVITVLFLSSCSLFGGSSNPLAVQEQNVRTAQSKLWGRDVKSGNTTAIVAVDMSSINPLTKKAEQAKFSISVNGDFDVAKKGDEKIQTNLTLSINAPNPDGSPMTGNIDADFVYLAKMLYINLKELAVSTKEFEQFKSFIDTFKNQWYFIDTSKNDNPVTAELSLENKLSAEQETKVKQILEKTDLFKVTKDLGKTTLNSMEMNHYAVSFNKDSVIPFIKEVSAITKDPFTADNEREVKEGLEKIDMTGEMWIGTKDNNLFRVSGTIKINDKKENTTGSITVDITLDPGKTISISTPTDAKDLMEEIGKMMAPMMEQPSNVDMNSGIEFNLNENFNIPSSDILENELNTIPQE